MSDLMHEAVLAHRANDLTAAERLYKEALLAQPTRADGYYNLATIYGQSGRDADALQYLQQAVTHKADFGQAWFLLAEFADKFDNHDLARMAAHYATQHMATEPRVWLRLGLILARAEDHLPAIEAFTHALKLDPRLTKAWVNLAYSAKAAGLVSEADTAIRQAITIAGQTLAIDEGSEAGYSFLHWHLALIELLQGKYREGFAYFRARFKGGTDWHRQDLGKSLWRGEDLRNKTILITAEQGHGDMLMLARYLPILQSLRARVILQTHPALVDYFGGWAGADRVIAIGDALPADFDYHAPIFDLPYRLHTTYETVPQDLPYLPRPLPVTLAGTGPKIGIIWAGQPDNIRGRNRSIPLAQFAEILLPGCSFFSLTRDLRAGEDQLLATLPITNLAPQCEDFSAVAAHMVAMDLIITCDTATAHLAGGLGLRTFTLLPFAADWRWDRGTDSTPWYPGMRLFRQRQAGDWRTVLAAVKQALSESFSHIGSGTAS